MPRVDIVREVTVARTPRVLQLEGMFDIPPAERSGQTWTVNLDLPDAWNVGLIVGPSGAGKTTVAREIFGACMVSNWDWPDHKSIIDGFPSDMSVKEVVELLSSVGFSSPPSWVRPFRVLSNGEQFRVNVARTLAEMRDVAVMDEFTSVVDRTVAKIASAAIQKTVRRRGQRFVAVSCHYDIAEWLEPDWVYEPHINHLTVGRRLRRPDIVLEVKRVHKDAWALFWPHHYLAANLNPSARCFVAFWQDTPVAFAAVMNYVGPVKNIKREHRLVCLPDYQGVGIGNALSSYIGALCRTLGWRYVSTTSHPAMIRARAKSSLWRMVRKPSITSGQGDKMQTGLRSSRASSRLTASFEYVGPPLADRKEAERIWQGD